MHISDSQPSPNTILTKCSKMTEEGRRRHGMNGSVDRISKEECPKNNYGQGGRLKFFKDGKFILELERAREGERVSWVSVPRKTFWPPHGTASSTPAYRQESSTSLSVSDDNSSIQSSPWQRDHSWKQTNPVRNKAKDMAFYFWRPKKIRQQPQQGGRGIKRRRPHSTVDPTAAESSPVRIKRERKKISLISIVQSLIDRNFRTSTPPRPETVVSPRKRFLREMEKDKYQPGARSPGIERLYSSEDGSVNMAQKRSRGRPQGSTAAPSPSSTPPSLAPKLENSTPPPPVQTRLRSNGVDEGTVVKPVRNCSYSITSLLAEDHHKGGAKRSPSHSPSQFPATVAQAAPAPPTARYCSPPTSDDRLYSESVDRLRSIELSVRFNHCYPPLSGFRGAKPTTKPKQAEKCGYPPYPPPHQAYMGGPYMYPFPPMPPYYGPGVYGRSGYVIPPIYHHHHLPPPPHHLVAHAAAATAPMALSSRRDSRPSSSWSGETNVTGRDVVDHRDDTVADMPLNLSKHSG